MCRDVITADVRSLFHRTATSGDVQRHFPSLLRAGRRLRGQRRPGEMSDAFQNDRRAQVRARRGPGRRHTGRLHHHQEADRGLGQGAGGDREEHLIRPGRGGQLRDVSAEGDGADKRGVHKLGEISAGAGGEVQAESGERAEGGAPAQRRLSEHGSAHTGRPEGHAGHFSGAEGQARAPVSDRPQPRHEAEQAEERVHEVLRESSSCYTNQYSTILMFVCFFILRVECDHEAEAGFTNLINHYQG